MSPGHRNTDRLTVAIAAPIPEGIAVHLTQLEPRMGLRYEPDPLPPTRLPADSALWDLPNVLVSPHTAALSAHEDRRTAEVFAGNATRLLDGEELLNRVDLKEFY